MRSWDSLAKRVSVRLPFRVTFRIERVDVLSERAVVTIHVPDVHTNEPTTVNVVGFLPAVDQLSDRQAFDFLYRLLKRAVDHEVEESFCVDTEQLYAPHFKLREPCPACVDARRISAIVLSGETLYRCRGDSDERVHSPVPRGVAR